MGRRGNPDWEHIVPELVGKCNIRATLPDPLSNAKTKPSITEFAVVRTATTLFGTLKYPSREEWLLDMLPKGGPNVLAGHSWGGGAAARFAVAHPDAVSHLVLISPDVENSVAQQLKCPTLLIWNKWDPINPYLWTRRFRGHPNLTLHTTKEGGHMIIDAHAQVIADWLKSQL